MITTAVRLLTALVPEVIMQKNVRLLIADDCPQTLSDLLMKTRSLGWKGTVVNSASKIIDAVNEVTLKGDTYDAIIADVNYQSGVIEDGPRMTGITAVREIRKVLPDLPIIFITEYINSIMKEEISRVKAELIPKPFDMDALFNRVNTLVKWHRSISSKPYTGPERRRTSLNLSNASRRTSDNVISPSPRISQVLTELRQEMKLT